MRSCNYLILEEPYDIVTYCATYANAIMNLSRNM